MDPLLLGVVLAGGAGRRMRATAGREASSKAAILLAGRPLVAYPLAVLREVCERVAVVAKRDTVLPDLDGVEHWHEPDAPRHPLVGIVHALECARGPVLVCAADMPFVTPDACRELIAVAAERGVRRTTVAVREGGLEPLLGVYLPEALAGLIAAPTDAPLRATIRSLEPAVVELPGSLLRSVNTPEELVAAAKELGGRRRAGLST